MSPPPSMPYTVVEVDRLQVSVPSILDDCFEFILDQGLTKGIFRVSGSVRRMKIISSDYSQYKTWLYDEKKPAVHDVCGIVKKYLGEYLDTMHGLFNPQLLTLLRRQFNAHRRTGSDCSIDSYKSANTSFGSLLLSSVPESDEEESFSKSVRDPNVLLDSIAHTLVTKNITSKNNFFIYLLYKLKQLSQHKEATSMTIDNSSIIFQPYIFNTANVSDLRPLQDLLTFLVVHFDQLLQKYQCYISILGGLEELDLDNISVSSSEGHAASPATVYSDNSYTPRHNQNFSEGNPKRKSSLSQRFSVFLDSYHLPANRSKRLSFNFSSKQNLEDKAGSSDNLRNSSHQALSMDTDFASSNEAENFAVKSYSRTSGDILTPPADDSLGFNTNQQTTKYLQPNVQSQVSKRPPSAQKKSNNSKRRSLITLFKSSSSVNDNEQFSKEEFSVPSPAPSPRTPVEGEFSILKSKHAASLDNLIPDSNVKMADDWKPVGRNLSLRLRGRKC